MKKNPYDLSYQHLLSCNMGEFVPIGIKEILPNDSIRHSVTALIRTMPLLKPLMHRVNASIVHYFVPTRIIWDDFENFITGGPNGTSEPVPPTVTTPASVGFPVGSLADHLGIKPGVPDRQVSALPFRAVAAIYNEWIRDQDLITPVNISTASGPDSTTNTDMLMAMWEKDYFTTARPWPQKGPEVMLPIVGDAPVHGLGLATSSPSQVGGTVKDATGMSVNYPRRFDSSIQSLFVDSTGTGTADDQPNVYADMSQVAGISIIDQRIANYIQRFQEKMARRGSQFKDYLRQLGVNFSDARLQIPERLGHSSTVLQFSEVLATAASEGIDVGDMKGHGITGVKTKGYDRWFEEHGFLVSFLVVRPKTVYMDMVNPMWFYKTKYDMWQPGLEHVGQQEILNKVVNFGHNTPEGVFAYQDRDDHYRYSENMVSGDFRSSENDWHMARSLPNDVALNASFVACNPTTRIFPDQLSDHLYVNVLHNLRARRLVSANTTSFLR